MNMFFSSMTINSCISLVGFIVYHSISFCNLCIFCTYYIMMFCYGKNYDKDSFYNQ